MHIRLLHSIINACYLANVYFTDTGNMRVSVKYALALGHVLSTWNYTRNKRTNVGVGAYMTINTLNFGSERAEMLF